MLLAGNNLGNECVTDVLSTLSKPEAPHIRQIDLSTNTRLNWRVAVPIAAALGVPPEEQPHQEGLHAATTGGGEALPPPSGVPSSPIEMLRLSRLLLGGTRLGDKGAAIIGAALKTNKVLKVRVEVRS